MRFNIALGIFLILGLIINQKILLIIFGLIATVPVLISAFNSIKSKKISIDLLAAMALTVSIIHKEWGSVAFINLMITSARIFEIYIQGRAKKALDSLIKLRPEKVKIKTKNKIVEISIKDLKVGDLVVVEMGERVAMDGVVVSGFASIDQSSLTGESLPIPKQKGDEVFCSTLNISGSIIVKTTKTGQETSFQKIIDLVKQAHKDKTGIKSIVDHFATWYISLTLILCLIIFFVTKNVNLVLALLLVTCADDIAVAIPLSYWGATAIAAKKGIIVKSGVSFEILKKLKILVVDKTGTLTKGQVEVQHCLVFGKATKDQLIKLAAGLACVSTHPMSKAIIKMAENNRISYQPMKEFEEIAGKGIIGQESKHQYLLGNLKLIKSKKVFLTKIEKDKYKKIENEGHNLVFFVQDKKLIGLFGLGDELRDGTKKAIENIKHQGVEKVIMLTGDNIEVAQKVSQEVKVDEFHANLLPQEKLKFIENESKNGKSLAFLGDGVNDAASLARANVGIAMGVMGTDAAIESADIALMTDNLDKINDLMILSKKLGRITIQNFTIWGTVNLIGLILVFGFKMSPEKAAMYNFVTDFIPLLNSVRIFKH